MSLQIGNYVLERPIASGGMGAVWQAHRADGHFEGRAAVKLLPVDPPSEGTEHNREAVVLARLEHPNIARLIDAGVTRGGAPYLVMEYVEGEPIDRWCDMRSLDVRARVALFLQALAAVAHAHNRLILHCDLKPSNILVTRDGQVKLIDFGTASVLEGEGATVATGKRDVANAGAWTPEYAAPEQVQGLEVTTATDVYAMAVVLYELLTGVHPTTRASQTALENLRSIVEVQPMRASRAVAQSSTPHARGTDASRLRRSRALRGDLDRILAMGLQKVPSARYRTPEAFADDLQRHLHNEPVRARGDSFWYRSAKLVARNRIASMSAAIVAGAIVMTGAGAIWQKQEAARQLEHARALAERNGAVIAFFRRILVDAAPADGPMSIGELLERSYGTFASGKYPPQHEAAVLSILAQFFSNNADSARAERLLHRALELSRGDSDPAMRVTLLCQTAGVKALLGRYDEAQSQILAAQALQSHDDLAAVTCHENESLLANLTGKPDAALAYAVQARERLLRSGVNRPDWGAVLHAQIADAHFRAGNAHEAERLYAASLQKLNEIGRDGGVATYSVRSRQAFAAAETGAILQALDSYDELYRSIDATRAGMAPPVTLLSSRGVVLTRLARYPEAIAAFDQAISYARRSANTGPLLTALACRADAFVAVGDVVAAQRDIDELDEYIQARAALPGRLAARIALARARLHVLQDRNDQALAHYSAVIDLGDNAESFLASALTERAELHLQLGDPVAALDDAEHAVDAARKVQRDRRRSSFTGLALATLAHVQEKHGTIEAARVAAQEAVDHLTVALGEGHPQTQRLAKHLSRLRPS